MEKGEFFREFFKSEARVVEWFSFRFSGKNEHGALALEHYLFMNRETLWEKLRWKGKRDVPPCVAIQKKNLLMELDLPKTLKLLSQDEQSQTTLVKFWDSEFFKESLESGEFLALDYDLFASELVSDLRGRSGKAKLLEVLKVYVIEEDFKDLCHKLLLLLKDREILNFIHRLVLPSPKLASSLETLINGHILCQFKWDSMDELLVCNAIANHPKQIVRFLGESSGNGMEALDGFLSSRRDEVGHWVAREELASVPAQQRIRFGLAQFWLLYCRLSLGCNDRDSMEALMARENIRFEADVIPKYESEGRHSSKRKRSSEEGEFVGWKFAQGVDGRGKPVMSKVVYNVDDTALYLSRQFLSSFIRQYAQRS